MMSKGNSMTAIPAALAPSVAPAARAGDSQSAAPDESAQPFGGVLAREIGRQTRGQNTPEDTAKTQEVAADEAQSTVSANDQQAAASPWLLMLQQFGSSLPVDPSIATSQAETSGDDAVDPDANQPNALLQWVQQSLAAAPAAATGDSSTAQSVVAESTDVPAITNTQNLPLQAANVSTDIGKELPQGLAKAGEQSSFADILGDSLDKASQVQSQPQLHASTARIEQASAARNEVGQHVVREPVGDARWGDVVAQRVSLMLGRQEQQMQMQLNPPHLGPMEVQLTLGADQASVVFTSQHAAVREALAAATPRLTALLADQGIQLVNVQVASDSLQQQAQQQSRNQASQERNAGAGEFFGQSPDAVIEKRALNNLNLQVARSGVSLYV